MALQQIAAKVIRKWRIQNSKSAIKIQIGEQSERWRRHLPADFRGQQSRFVQIEYCLLDDRGATNKQEKVNSAAKVEPLAEESFEEALRWYGWQRVHFWTAPVAPPVSKPVDLREQTEFKHLCGEQEENQHPSG